MPGGAALSGSRPDRVARRCRGRGRDRLRPRHTGRLARAGAGVTGVAAGWRPGRRLAQIRWQIRHRISLAKPGPDRRPGIHASLGDIVRSVRICRQDASRCCRCRGIPELGVIHGPESDIPLWRTASCRHSIADFALSIDTDGDWRCSFELETPARLMPEAPLQ